MSVKVESLSPTRIRMTFEVPASKVKEEREAVFRETVKTVQLKGFRKGKAPRQMVEKALDPGVFEGEIQRRLMNGAFELALKAEKIRLLTRPQIEILRFKEGEPFTFQAVFERWPEVPLPDYKEISVQVRKRELKEEEIGKVLRTLQEQRAVYAELPQAAVEEGRAVVADLDGSVDGKVLEGWCGQGLVLEIQKDWPALPGLMEKMAGMKSGEERVIAVVLPAGFDPSVAGKEAVFKVRVHAVKEKKHPEITDEFAQSVGREFKTVDDLKASVRKQLESWHEHEEKSEGLKKVTETWETSLDFPVPEILIEPKLKQLEREILQNLSAQGKNFGRFLKERHPEAFAVAGVKEEEQLNRAVAKFREDLRPAARKQAKIDLILDEIARKESLRLSREEINSEMARLSQSLRMSPEALAKVLRDKELIDDFLAGILRTKAALLIRENLKLSYLPPENRVT